MNEIIYLINQELTYWDSNDNYRIYDTLDLYKNCNNNKLLKNKIKQIFNRLDLDNLILFMANNSEDLCKQIIYLLKDKYTIINKIQDKIKQLNIEMYYQKYDNPELYSHNKMIKDNLNELLKCFNEFIKPTKSAKIIA